MFTVRYSPHTKMVSFVTYAWSHSPRLLLHRKLWQSISPSAQLNGSTNWFWRLAAQSLANSQLCRGNQVCCEVWENTAQSWVIKYSAHFPSAVNLKSALALCYIASKWGIRVYIRCVSREVSHPWWKETEVIWFQCELAIWGDIKMACGRLQWLHKVEKR